jgi:hypothetical protein
LAAGYRRHFRSASALRRALGAGGQSFKSRSSHDGRHRQACQLFHQGMGGCWSAFWHSCRTWQGQGNRASFGGPN